MIKILTFTVIAVFLGCSSSIKIVYINHSNGVTFLSNENPPITFQVDSMYWKGRILKNRDLFLFDSEDELHAIRFINNKISSKAPYQTHNLNDSQILWNYYQWESAYQKKASSPLNVGIIAQNIAGPCIPNILWFFETQEVKMFLLHFIKDKRVLTISLQNTKPFNEGQQDIQKIFSTVSFLTQSQVDTILKTETNYFKKRNKSTSRELSDFTYKMQIYFLHPDFDTLASLLSMYDKLNLGEFTSSARMPVIGFFTTAFGNIKNDSLKLNQLINQSYSHNELIQYSYKLSSENKYDFDPNSHSANLNDFYWGAFFASGDKQYINRISMELRNINEKDSLMLLGAACSAKWSLCSNAHQYPLVKKYLIEIKEESDSIVSNEIKDLLLKDPNQINQEMQLKINEYKQNHSDLR